MRQFLDYLPLAGVIIFFIGILGIGLSYLGPAIGLTLDPEGLRPASIKVAGVGLVAYVVFHLLLPSSARR